VVVTEIVEKEGEQVIVTQVVEVPAEPVEEEAAGPIPADEMVPCQPVPEVAGINMTQVSAAGPAAPKIVSDVPETVTLLTKKLLQEGNVYKVGVFEDVTTLNFWAANGPDNTVWNSYMLPHPPSLFILTDKYFSLVPQLAAVSTPDPLVQEGDFWVTSIPIKQDVVWSDGSPLTAKDVAFTANAVVDLGLISGNFQSWYDPNYLDSAEVVDDYTVKFLYHTKPGLARHEWGTLQAPILSAAYWEPIVTEALAPIQALGDSPSEEDLAAAQAEAHDILFAHQVSGEPTADAYMLDKWEQGAFLQSVANPNYFETGLTIEQYADGAYKDSSGVVIGDPKETVETTYTIGPYFDAVVYTIYGSQDAAILAMKNGEVDFVINPLGLQAGLEAQVRSDPNLTWVENPVNGYRYLSFNNRRRPMNDCAFRQAVAVLIDKEFVTGTILQGVAFPMYTFLPEANTAWYFDGVPKLGKDLTREQRTNLAVAILEQAGYTWEGDVKPAWDADNRQVTQAGRLIMPDGTPVPELHMQHQAPVTIHCAPPSRSGSRPG